MATMQTLIENIPSTPDIAALSAMNAPIVVVTKVSGAGKRGNDQLVINGQTGLTTNDILKLQDTLPTGNVIANSGPGVYRFEITDGDSGAKSVWQIRLGGVPIENAEPMGQRPVTPVISQPIIAAQQAAKAVPLAPDVQNLGNGWFYNPTLSLLTAPDGNLHVWRPGTALPQINLFGAVPAQAPSTALPALPPLLVGNPEAEAMRQQLSALQGQLSEAREREREQKRQDEIREMQTSFNRSIEETNKRFEMLVTKLSEPKNEDNGKLMDLERRLAEKDRIDGLRAEMKAQTDSLMAIMQAQTAANANKGVDPVVNMLTTMLTQMQANAGSNFTLLREMSNQERQMMERMMDKNAETMEKSGNLDIVTKVMGGMDMIFDRLRQVTQLEREISGGGNSGPDWMGVIKEVGSRAGSAMQMFMAAKAREADAAKTVAQAEIAKSQASVVHDRAAVAVARSRQQLTSVPAPAAEAADAPDAPAAAPETESAAVETPPVAPAPGAVELAKKGAQPKTLSDLSLKDLRKTFKGEPDAVFFGGFAEHVQSLRDEIAKNPNDNSAEDIASYVLQAREFIAAEAQEGRITHAAELMVAEQIAYLIERILPDVSEGLRSEIIKAIKRHLATEADAARVAAAAGKPTAS
jgi:hypothetical protein